MKILKLTLLFLLSFTTSIYAFDVPTANYSDDEFTELLIHGDQDDGTAGTDILDSSHNDRTITAVDDAQVDTGQFKDLTGSTGSIMFDGAGDYLSIANNAAFQFGAGDFTVDAWYRFSAFANKAVFSRWNTADYSYNLYQSNTTTFVFYYSLNGTAGLSKTFTTPITLLVDTWYHLAVIRDGNDLDLFVDGVASDPTASFDVTLNDGGEPLIIGHHPFWSIYHDGWIDEFRVSKGIARFGPTDTGDVMIIRVTKNFINNLNPNKIGTPLWTCKIKAQTWWKNFYWDHIRTKEVYASPLTIRYKHDTISIDNPIIDKICSNNRIKSLVKQARDAINQKNYKRLIFLGTEALKICIKSLSQ